MENEPEDIEGKVIELFPRGKREFQIIRGSATCSHREGTIFDQESKIIWCRTCQKILDPFEVLASIVEEWSQRLERQRELHAMVKGLSGRKEALEHSVKLVKDKLKRRGISIPHGSGHGRARPPVTIVLDSEALVAVIGTPHGAQVLDYEEVNELFLELRDVRTKLKDAIDYQNPPPKPPTKSDIEERRKDT